MKFLAVTETKILIFKMHPFKSDSVLVGMEQYVCQGVLGARGMFNILTKTHGNSLVVGHMATQLR